MTGRLPFDDLGALPPPDAAARAHGERVLAMIREVMRREGGAIPFARYMDLALHAPALGYYSAGSAKLGVAGDFVTAPEISSLFGRCLARQAAQVLMALDGGEILEIGAGSGVMACDILAELERLQALPARYCILESSADLRARQEALIRDRLPHLAARVAWLDRLPAAGFRGLMLANELLDAMPVHLLVQSGGDPLEAHVRWDEDRFAWVVGGAGEAAGSAGDPRLAARLEAIFAELGRDAFVDGYRFEINLAMESWLAAAAAALDAGLLLLIDYGYPRRAYYHPQRGAGTLMCHYRHRAHDDPLILPGLQDMTAHIDFTALAEAGLAQELKLAGYNSQAWFLFGCGLQDLVADAMQSATDDLLRARISQQVQRLTLPGEMGEKIKVMALSRRLDVPLCGFSLRDERGSL